ncbi:stage III sporulation protein AB [Anaeroselena agilis]|uniref:Stage III sporulation protein AB n=1 Tax=Anaeroselena agilis TaxID=3063788 RepID=A0ABU3NW64_9FIRM|nr:stage III sporulation protein AB [Selenomonadales bacterium 4137-cl]
MWVKLLGSAMVIVAGTGIGFAAAWRYSERPRQIGHLISCLTALSSYVNYAALPLAEALSRAAGGLNSPVGDFLRRTAANMAARNWLSPREALEEALAEEGRRLAWERPERETLLLFGANLGATGREEQQKYLAMVLEELRRIEHEALRSRDQNVKMYRYLGICGGLATAILLV